MRQRNKTPLDMARNREEGILREWGKHTKTCGTCITLYANANCYCAEGWKIAGDYHQVRNEILALRTPISESGENLLW